MIPSHSSIANHENLSTSGAGSDASSFYFRPHSQSHSHMIQPCILDGIWPSPCRQWHHPSACTTAASRSITHSWSHSHMMQPYNCAHPGFSPLRMCHQWHHPSACTTTASRSINEMTQTPAQARWLSHMLCTGMPLTSILALPPESVTGKLQGNRTSYDSILDGEGRRSSETAAHLPTLSLTKPATSLQFHWSPCSDMMSFVIPKEVYCHPISSGLSPCIVILLIIPHTMRTMP